MSDNQYSDLELTAPSVSISILLGAWQTALGSKSAKSTAWTSVTGMTMGAFLFERNTAVADELMLLNEIAHYRNLQQIKDETFLMTGEEHE